MMYVYSADSAAVRERLEDGAALVASLCAERCHRCDDWWGEFRALSELFPEACFVWLDVDEHPDMVADIPGLNTFPFLLVYGPETASATEPEQAHDPVPELPPPLLRFMAPVLPDQASTASLLREYLALTSPEITSPGLIPEPGLRSFLLEG